MLKKCLRMTSIKRYDLTAIDDIKNVHTSLRRLERENSKIMENKHWTAINEMLSKYDKEKEETILNFLNNCNLDEISNYKISKARANKFLDWRVRHGMLKNLHVIFSIDSFDLKVADKFFHSILHPPKTSEGNLSKVQTKTTQFVTPSLGEKQRQTIKSTVSVHIGVNSITWSRLHIPDQNVNAPCLLTDWEHHEISEKKLHINELIQHCLYVHHLIPAADCYIFESPQIAQVSNNPSNVEQKNINIQKAQIFAILGYALTSRKISQATDNKYGNNSISLPNVFYLKRFLAARIFNHLIGNEKVSSEQTVLNMMRMFYNTNELKDNLPLQQSNENTNFSTRIQFPTALREMFSNVSRYHREFLGQTLLLNLAFTRLILLQDAEVIAAIAKRGHKNKSTLNKDI